MYNFIFWFFYKFHEWRDNDNSTFVPAAAVMFTLSIHLGFIYSVYRYFAGITTPLYGTELSYGQRKYLMLPVALLILVIIWVFYYRKKAKYILEKYEGKKALTPKNIALVLLIIIVPLLVAIKLTTISLG